VSSPDSDAEYAERKDAALARLAEGEPEQAFEAFRFALWYAPGTPLECERFADAIGVFSRIAVAMGHRELAELAARVSTDPDDADALYDLGYQLLEAGLPAIAATTLRRCLEVVPGTEQVLTELIAALERMLLYREAKALLAAHPQLVASSFLCRYLYAYDAAMSGDLATTRELAPGLAPDSDTERFMAARIAAILARADRVGAVTKLDDVDLRGWHYVLTGGVLLHRSPHGFEDAMRGRYAWLLDSTARVRAGLVRLRDALRTWGETVDVVYAPPGRDHEILGETAARILEVPRAPWPAVGVPAPGLIVAYDLAEVPFRELERLAERRAGQILYAHASRWTDDGPVAPDVTMLLYQSIVPPWGPRVVLDPATGEHRTTEPDARDVEALAAEIAAAPPLDADETEADDLAGLDALVGAARLPEVGRRERLWAGSPVASNRFL
jgi:tetratricopeptide (TPR) repeat protein